MWLDIHNQFKQSDGPRTAEIKQQIFAETQGSQSVSDYYTKLKQLWEELKNHEGPYTCCCGRPDCASLKRIVAREEQDHILKFLTGLNDTFTATRGQILMMEPRPNISKVFNLVSQEERQRSMKSASAVACNISQPIADDNLVAAYNGGYNRNRPRPMCSHCGLVGHTVNRCYKLHGYPQGYKPPSSFPKTQSQVQAPGSQKSSQNWPPRKENVANMVLQDSGGISMHTQQGVHLGSVTPDQVHQLLSVLSLQTTPSQISGSTIHLSDGTASTSKPQPHLITHLASETPPSGNTNNYHFVSAGMKNGLTTLDTTWIIDTGASCHVCFDLKMFLCTNSISDTFVTLPDGTRIQVEISGTITITPRLTLTDVLFIPHFKFNLLSISALTRNSTIYVLFPSYACYIFPGNLFLKLQEHTPDYMIGKGNLHNNLYVLDAPASPDHHSSASHSVSSATHNVFHQQHTQDHDISLVSSEIWHQRLGHPSHQKIQILSKFLQVSGSVKSDHWSLCKVCPLAKQKRISFP